MAQNKLAMAASERRRSRAESSQLSQAGRRASMMEGRRRSSVRCASIYDDDDMEKLPSNFCTFEVTRHSVEKLLNRLGFSRQKTKFYIVTRSHF